MMDRKTQGKKNREKGQRFEVKVRKELEKKGWIVDRWSNNVEIDGGELFISTHTTVKWPKLVPARPGPFNLRTTGFPDFITFRVSPYFDDDKVYHEVIGVECKSGGYLTKEEKEKCKWLIENNVFSKILIAKKGKKRGEIEYVERKN